MSTSGNPDCTWRGWRTTVVWDDDDVEPVVRDRLQSFLRAVLTTLEALARRVDGAGDTDAIAALGSELGPMPAPWADDSLTVLREWSTAIADEARVTGYRTEVDHAVAGEPAPVRWVAVALLLARILRATFAGRCEQLDDPDGVLTAAEVLYHQVRQVLGYVSTGEMSAAEYRLM